MHKRISAVAGALGLAVVLGAGSATAASMTFTLMPFTGDGVELTIMLDDGVVDGSVQLTATVSSGIGDIRGIFFNVVDDALLAGLSVTGSDVTNVLTDDVMNVGRGSNVNGGGSPCPCDVGVAIGSPGMGKDDIQTTVFLISHDMMDLDLSLFDGQTFGGRLTSVGTNRNDSAKLMGVVPEPSTALLLAAGMGGIAARRRLGH